MLIGMGTSAVSALWQMPHLYNRLSGQGSFAFFLNLTIHPSCRVSRRSSEERRRGLRFTQSTPRFRPELIVPRWTRVAGLRQVYFIRQMYCKGITADQLDFFL
ncbi:hypothetical protein EK904_013340 [Melospiza melodia maxima]|nr:hypothetical protein EK904_013340 [Melospiza melodia maxima]